MDRFSSSEAAKRRLERRLSSRPPPATMGTSLVERAADVREFAFDAGADGGGFVGLGENGIERGVDAAVGHAAGAQLAGDAETALPAKLRVLAGEFGGEAGVVEIVELAESSDHV